MVGSPLRPSLMIGGVRQAESIRCNNLVYEMKAAGCDVITLSLGEAFFDIPLPDFAHVAAAGLHHYSHSRGLPELRRRLADYYGRQCHVQVGADDEIIVTAGSKAAIYMTLLAALDPGDEVIIPEPFWVSYPEQVRLCGGQPVMVPHEVSIFDIGSYISQRTRAIVLNNPNNPTGHVYSAEALRFLHDLADRNGLLLIVDEAYNEFVPPGAEFVSAGAFDQAKQHTVIVNSMSKNYGISGWRIGYVIAHRQLTDQILKINQHLVTCAATILQGYLAEHFDRLIGITRPQIRRTVALRNKVSEWLSASGIATLPGSASFYLFASLGRSALGSVAFATTLLRERAISVVPGIGYGASCDRYIRISVGTEPENRVARGISEIARLIEASRASGS
jgi:aspartate aminotransferase/aminotransferase